jgi:glutamine amidotransferase-like uncharacterized protein
LETPYLEKAHHNKGLVVAQGVSPEFKPHYQEKKETLRSKNLKKPFKPKGKALQLGTP